MQLSVVLEGDGGNVTLVGIRLQLGPLGLTEVLTVTVPAKPLIPVMDIVDEALTPTGAEKVEGLALMVKS